MPISFSYKSKFGFGIADFVPSISMPSTGFLSISSRIARSLQTRLRVAERTAVYLFSDSTSSTARSWLGKM